MIANFAEDEKRGFFSARSWNRTVIVFFAWLGFLLLYLEKELVLSPLFLFMGCFRKFL